MSKPKVDLGPRPIEVQRAIVEQEREAYANTIYQLELRLEGQERLKSVLGADVAEAIKALTRQHTEALVLIAFLDEKLAALPSEEGAKAA
ncbi:MAG TPA: hypothetical protein VF897_11735 [Roseiflexaceae bacterium]